MLDFRQRLSLKLSRWVAERVDRVRISDLLYRDMKSLCRVCGLTSAQLKDVRRAVIASALSAGDRWFDEQREPLHVLLDAGGFPPECGWRSVFNVESADAGLAGLMQRKPPPQSWLLPVVAPVAPEKPRLTQQQRQALNWLSLKRKGHPAGRRRSVPQELRSYDYSLAPRHRLQPGDLDRLHAYRVQSAEASEADCDVWFYAKQLGLAFAAQKLGMRRQSVDAAVSRVDRFMPCGQRVFLPSLAQVERGLWSMVLWRNALLAREGLLVGVDDCLEGVNLTPEWLLRACLFHGSERLILEAGVVSLAWAGLEPIPGGAEALTPSAVFAWLGQVQRLLVEGSEGALDTGWRAEPAGLRPRALPNYVALASAWIEGEQAASLAEALDERIASARDCLRSYRSGACPPSFD